MSQITCFLSANEAGDAGASAQVLPLVYDELRKLAAQRLAVENPGLTLQATALVPKHQSMRRRRPGRPRKGHRTYFLAALHQVRHAWPAGTLRD
jgi:hypothetical protein